MADITLIEQSIRGTEFEDENFVFRLTTDEKNENFIFSFKLMSCSVTEQTETGTPIVMLTVMDMLGDLVNHRIVEGDFVFKLFINRTDMETNVFHLKPSKIRATNSTGNRNDQIIYTMYLVDSKWTAMHDIKHNRAWTDVTYAEVAQEIADEIGYETTFITPTKRKVPLIIQPYWTNYDMLKWLQKHSTPEQNSKAGAFYFGSTVNNGFFFASLGDLIKEKLNPVAQPGSNREQVTLTMRDIETTDYERGYRRMSTFDLHQDFMGSLLSGASGLIPAHYDYMTKTYVKGEPIQYSESEEPMLSDWSMLSEEHENASKVLFTHRDKDSVALARNRVSEAVNYTQKVSVEVEGVSEVQLADVVEIQIPLSSENSKTPFNEYFSGSYIVTRKKTYFDINSAKARTMMYLTRQGVNGQDVKRLVKSSTGKSL